MNNQFFKIFAFVLASFVCGHTKAQFNNGWIDYSKTYYKFEIPSDGLFRLNQSVLAAAGLGSVPVQQFQIFRNGQQVPLYTSNASGVMGSSDYIEFWGKGNDGTFDNQLYNISSHQLNRRWSLYSDTAAYFLTTNSNAAANARFVTVANNVAGNTLPVTPNFMYTAANYFKDVLHPGYATIIGEYLHSSAYDNAEGWSSNYIYSGQPFNTSLTNLYPDLSATIPASLCYAAAGYGLQPRSTRTTINGTVVDNNRAVDYFGVGSYCVPFNVNVLSSGNANISFSFNNSQVNDRCILAYQEIKYPRLFNFGGQSNFEFELAASAVGNYLEITNFNRGGAIPVLYDLSNRGRYVADINGSTLRFALLPSATPRKMVLVSEDAGNINQVNNLVSKQFTNFMATVLQGNYIIISSKVLHDNTAPSNVVEKYKAYRQSVQGGSHNVIIVDVEDLYDQYAFGNWKHPIAIRNYLRQARSVFTDPVKNVLLIGRATFYEEEHRYKNFPYRDILNSVPTFGWPASDNLLAADPGTTIQQIPIGRLGAIYKSEVETYLDKVKQYEANIKNPNFTIANKLWMKSASFVTGSSEPFLQTLLDQHQREFLDLWKTPKIGGIGDLFTKTSAGGVVPLTNAYMEQKWNEGHSLLHYFGHSSATALEFNMDDPNIYNNQGKYPLMVINGCNAGNYFIYNPFRVTTNTNMTLSEKYVFTPNKGSIGFIASTSYGIVNYLYYWNKPFMDEIRGNSYGKSIGEVMKIASQRMYQLTGTVDFYARMQGEQTLLQGDPAITMNVQYPKPDYVLEDQHVKVSSNFIAISQTDFKIKAYYFNLGKANVGDSMNVKVTRQYPSGVSEVIHNRRVKAAYYGDSLEFSFNIIPLRDKGLNKITICLDGDNEWDEMAENNNCITKDVFIFEDEARPVHPYNYAIINTLPVKLVASTANPLAVNRTYNLELDTTELFNSPIKITQNLTQVGGTLEFGPFSNLVPNTVYYWRVSVAGVSPLRWNTSSFTYAPSSGLGFNQGHFYQHTKSDYDKITLDSTTKKFRYDSVGINISVRNGVWPSAAYEEGHVTVSVNQDPYIRGYCRQGDFQRIVFHVFDPITGKPWLNTTTGGVGMFNSAPSNCNIGRQNNFEYSFTDIIGRNKADAFLRNNVPSGYYVIARSLTWWTVYNPSSYVDGWKTDAAANGNNLSLYNTFISQGLNLIDSMNQTRSFIFIFRKDGNGFTPIQKVSENDFDRISSTATFVVPDTTGSITSPAFGPAKTWQELHWRGNSIESPTNDSVGVTILGVRANGVIDSIRSVNLTQIDHNISDINANIYPYIKLRLITRDAKTASPWQLDYWRLNYVPIPEGAVAPNITLQLRDTVEVGEPMQVKVAFKNISYVPFDSLKVRFIILDKNGASTIINLPKQKPLAVNETLTLDHTIPTANFGGLNSIYVEFNPDNDQPEQFHFNNFFFKNFYVIPDVTNPLLDVTFDGVHILNEDIVSASPLIKVKLKDENRWQALNDTAGLKIQLKFPGSQAYKSYYWNSDTLKFFPPTLINGTGDNSAFAELSPKNLPDGQYELLVSGKDINNNKAGDLSYKVLFKVVGKPQISNLLNYPNPFTTSTQFVFTLTGNEVPQNIKIEIMTVTGKIVREITKAELGPIRIGRNITEYKWDGTDQFGNKLANGVYLYRVVTNLNGKGLEKFKVNDDDNTDIYFKNGYGKMVIIR